MVCLSFSSRNNLFYLPVFLFFPFILWDLNDLFSKFIFIYLALLGLSCSVQDLLVVASGIKFPDQGLKLGPLDWVCEVLATGPAGKS